MSLPDEQVRALCRVWRLLMDLMSPQATPGVPGWVRQRVRDVTRHYPPPSQIVTLSKQLSDEEWHRLINLEQPLANGEHSRPPRRPKEEA